MTRAQFEQIDTGDVVFFGSLRRPRTVLEATKNPRGRTWAITLAILRESWTHKDYTTYCHGDRHYFGAKRRGKKE